jgi:RNA polymerase sigma-70 factor (ECF subfamily)
MMPSSLANPLESFASHDEPELDAEALCIQALKRGSVEALGELYDRHHVAVRAFAGRLLGDPSAAEDLLQEVFLGVPGAIHNYQGDSSIRTFLIGIAVNKSRHHVRAATRRRAAVDRMAAEPVTATLDPERLVMREEAADALVRALDELSHDHRVAFVLCEVEERSSSEVAKIVRAPEGTVRTRLFHAKKKLRESLEARGLR